MYLFPLYIIKALSPTSPNYDYITYYRTIISLITFFDKFIKRALTSLYEKSIIRIVKGHGAYIETVQDIRKWVGY